MINVLVPDLSNVFYLGEIIINIYNSKPIRDIKILGGGQ
jgi:hypothetical protein